MLAVLLNASKEEFKELEQWLTALGYETLTYHGAPYWSDNEPK